MNSIIKNNIDAIRTFCVQHDVESLYAFGSVTTDSFSDDSDIDLLVKFRDIPVDKYTDNYFELLHLFRKIFNRKIDLMTENSLANPYFIKKVNQTKTLIYEG